MDTAVVNDLKLPWETYSLEFRSRALDLIDFVNYTNLRLSLLSPGAFGEFQAAARPRLLQLARLSKLAAEVKKRWR